MASTITLQNTVDYARPFLNFKLLNLGTGGEPAITIANIVKQTILGAPFTWRWNRAAPSAAFVTVSGTQDYQIVLSDFGFLESASSTLASQTRQFLLTLNSLSLVSDIDRPDQISPLLDDNAGNITFRLTSVPDDAYTVGLVYQKKATLFTAVTDTWSPIPDEYSFVYNHGFLALSMLYIDDPRWAAELPRFLASLVGISEGLDQNQINIFLNSWLTPNTQARKLQALSGQGQAALGAQTIGER